MPTGSRHGSCALVQFHVLDHSKASDQFHQGSVGLFTIGTRLPVSTWTATTSDVAASGNVGSRSTEAIHQHQVNGLPVQL
jgi:hypothetical protein